MAETLAAKVTKAPSIVVRQSRNRVVGVAWMNAAKGTRVIWISSKTARNMSAGIPITAFETLTSVKNDIPRVLILSV